LTLPFPPPSRLRVCAVSYLNTTPLVWGMLHGPQQGLFDLQFRVPSACADMVASGEADIGIIPSFELLRQNLAVVPGVGIVSRGAVRSILLVSKCPAAAIRTLAADSGSRTSVALARIILQQKFGSIPTILSCPPALEPMLSQADAALIIGDPALRLDPASLGEYVYDLGAEWTTWTGLPMVFAVWAGRQEVIDAPVIAAFQESCRYGREHLEEIISGESKERGFAPELVRAYLTSHIVTEMGEAEEQGLELFLRFGRAILQLIDN
jgi:chorismate dehydratase